MKTKQLLFLLFVALLPLTAWADVWQDPETKVNYEYDYYGDATVIESSDASGDIIIPSKIRIPYEGNWGISYDEYSVTRIGDNAFFGCSGLTSIAMDSVVSIGNSAFSGCNKLYSVSIPSTLKEISDDAFANCNNLMAVNISDLSAWCNISFGWGISPTANPLSYAEHLFLNGEEVKDVVIPNDVTVINHYIFCNCIGLNSVSIPESVSCIDDNAFAGCKGLKTVSIANGLIYIGRWAFGNCRSLTSITLPSSLTDIGEGAFAGCTSLTNIVIPENVTSIGQSAFSDCSSLTNVTLLPILHLDNSIFAGTPWYEILPDGLLYQNNVLIGYKGAKPTGDIVIEDGTTTIINDALSGCNGITSVTIPSSVTSIGDWAFYGCSALTAVHISDIAAWCDIQFDDSYSNPLCYAKHLYLNGYEVKDLVIPEGVTSIGNNAFYNCSGLTSVTIPKSVTTIGSWAFAYCINLTSITIPEGVTCIGDHTFSGCTGLTSVTIPKGVTSIGSSAFSGCTGLTSVTIPEGVTSIGSSAFSGCTGLTSVTIPEGVTNIEYRAFANCSSLASVSLPSTIISIDSHAFEGTPWYDNMPDGLYYQNNILIGYKGAKPTGDIVIEDGTTTINDSALSGCSGITSVTIPSSVTCIGECAFTGCSSLISVNIPNGVTSVGRRTFAGCRSLISINIPSSVTSIGGEAFEYCNSLTAVHILDVAAWCGIIYQKTWDNPLYYAKHLYLNGEEISGDLIIPDGVASIAPYAFYYCKGLTSVVLPSSVTSIGNYAFYGCSGLTSVTIPEGVTSIGNYAFYDCSSLTSVTIPEGVASIGVSAFCACSGLTSVTIPSSVTSIEYNAFSSCRGLTSVTIPEGVISIGEDAFSGCSGLTSVAIPSSVTKIGWCAFNGCSRLTAVHISDVAAWCGITYQAVGDNPLRYAKHLYLNGEEISGDLIIPDGVTSIAPYAFYYCKGLTCVSLPSSLTSVGNNAFMGCDSLTRVSASCGEIGSWFSGRGIKELILREGVTTISKKAFNGCGSLTSIHIPSSLSSVGEDAFVECRNISDVYITDVAAWCAIDFKSPSSNPLYKVNDNFLTYGYKNRTLYLNGSEVTDLVIPDGVPSIGYCAFLCSRIKSCTIPESVTSIGVGAFYNCDQLDTVRTYIQVPFEIDSTVFCTAKYTGSIWVGSRRRANSSYTYSYPSTLVVPNGTKPLYDATSGWDVFMKIVEKDDSTLSTIHVIDENGIDITNKVSILWYDARGTQIGTGKSIDGIEDDTELYYSIVLNEELGRVYREVKMRKVKEDETVITCQLERIEQLTLHGKVTSFGMEVARADVSLTQWLNGKYEYTAVTKTDANGEFLLKAYNDSTELTVSCQGYVDSRMARRTLNSNGELGTIDLQPVTGKVIDLALSYQEAVKQGQEPVVQNWYSDTRNIEYGVTNVTKDIDITDISIQQGAIVLPTGTDVGDLLRVTLRSLNGKFAEVSAEGTVGANDTAHVEIRLVALGGVEAVCGSRGDDQLVAMLYDSTGKLASHATFSSSRVTFTELPAGRYSLVTMGYSGAVGVIGSMSDLDMIGLAEGDDYVLTTVNIEDGIIGSVIVGDVPELDVSKFEMTSVNTSYLPNKAEMVVGNFVTLTARVDFKTQYANEVDNVKLIVDIPEGCGFIDYSVVTGIKALPHTINGNELTIMLSQEDIDSRISFCMTPMKSGAFVTSARTTFNYHGEKTQNVGSTVFEATAGSISVPANSTSTIIPVNGIAAPHVEVDIYDNDHLVGSTTSQGDGRWSAKVELYQPYNLSTHEVYAKFINGYGYTETTSSQECFCEKVAPEAKSVTMSFYNGWLKKNVEVTFDYERGKTSSNSYMFYTATDITFVADLTENNTTAVNGVTFYVYTTSNQVRTLRGFFDDKLARWVAVDRFDSYNLPNNVSVRVDANNSEPLLSAEQVNELDAYMEGLQNDVQTSMNDVDSQLEALFSACEEEIPDWEHVSAMAENLYSILELSHDDDGDADINMPEEIQAMLNEVMNSLNDTIFSGIETIYSHTFAELVSYENLMEGFTITDCSGLDSLSLIADGFKMTTLDNLTCVFERQTETTYEYVNLATNKHIVIDLSSENALARMAPSIGGTIESVVEGVRTMIERRNEFYNTLSTIKKFVEIFQKSSDQAFYISRCNFTRSLHTYLTYVKARSEGHALPMSRMIENEFKSAAQKAGRMMNGAKKLSNGLRNTAQIFGKVAAAFNIIAHVDAEVNNLNQVIDTYFLIPDPDVCPNDKAQAASLQRRTVALGVEAFTFYSLNLLTDVHAAHVAAASAAALAPSGGVSAVPLLAALGKIGLHAALDAGYNWGFRQSLSAIRRDIKGLKCKKEKDDDNDGNDNNSVPPIPPTPPVPPIHDPSGFVYEAVPTNRIEGVTATIYEQELSTTPWDAADFSQVNPQVTDETGLYRWDVPQGMWQVRFEKSGYETTQTDWLPVPPPQLEINIPMSQAVAPQVVKARGTESGVTLEFSKYMKPSTLEKSRRVTVTVNGKNASGDVELMNAEENPYNNMLYVSRVKFVPDVAFRTTDEVVVTVKKEVESYADKQMAEDFVATVKIEPEINGLQCDSLIAVDYQGEGVLEIAVLPAAAAKGRMVSIIPISPMIATADQQSVTLDSEGKARLTVSGNLPGSASLHLLLDGTDVEKYVEVNVVLAETVVKTPKASKRSGSTIEAGYLLSLTSSTAGATIYYTLDGSCPCDEQTRTKYTGPFVLPEGEVTLKAIATRAGMEDSDVATFTYTVESVQGISGTIVSHDFNAEFADGTLTITGVEGGIVRVYDLLGRELASRQSVKGSLMVRVPQAETYIVSVVFGDGQIVVRKVTGR